MHLRLSATSSATPGLSPLLVLWMLRMVATCYVETNGETRDSISGANILAGSLEYSPLL
jgi:hypothetical protein